MHSPSIDIIVPVWNSPFETRACLAAILDCSPEARLIIVDNGSNRETELMLEEFSDQLGDKGLFIKSERNLGLVPAVNMGLSRSDSDMAVVVRPHVTVTDGWLAPLVEAAREPDVGIVTPVFRGSGAPLLISAVPGCSRIETSAVSFSALLLKAELRILVGSFDEGMDGGAWCLKEYVRRAWNRGYRTSAALHSELLCGLEPVFGSDERRQELTRASRRKYLERWGTVRHYCLYFGVHTDAGDLSGAIETLLEGCRRGLRFTLLLHRRQAAEFRRRGWNALHTAMQVHRLSMIRPQRDLIQRIAALKAEYPEIILVRGNPEIPFPGVESAISFTDVAAALGRE
jgi:glycosyltransferase involved in cell wall biosynthesis